jgi:hypothetical protein
LALGRGRKRFLQPSCVQILKTKPFNSTLRVAAKCKYTHATIDVEDLLYFEEIESTSTL